MKLEQIEYVAKIEQYHSINQAAKSMYFTQPFLSASIRALEEELGYKVFERSTQGALLTTEDEEFLRLGKQVQELVRQMYAIGEQAQKPVQKLCCCYVHSFHMIDLIREFSASQGDRLELEMQELENSEVFYRVAEDPEYIGVAFTYGPEYSPWHQFCKERRLDFAELCREPVYAVFGEKHPLFARESVTYADLSRFEAVSEQGHKQQIDGSRYSMAEFLQKHLRLSRIFFDNNRSKLYFVSKSDFYYGIHVKWLDLGDPLIQNGEIRYVPITDARAFRRIGLVFNRSAGTQTAAKSFAAYLKQRALQEVQAGSMNGTSGQP